MANGDIIKQIYVADSDGNSYEVPVIEWNDTDDVWVLNFNPDSIQLTSDLVGEKQIYVSLTQEQDFSSKNDYWLTGFNAPYPARNSIEVYINGIRQTSLFAGNYSYYTLAYFPHLETYGIISDISDTKVSFIAPKKSGTYLVKNIYDWKGFAPSKIINFFRSTPPRDEEIVLERGQSIEVGFTAVYEGTEGEPYTGTVIWNNPYPEEISISGNTITVSETARNPSVQLTAYPSEHEEGDTLYDFVVINVSNPLGVYDTGGTTGGQNQTGGGGAYGKLPDGSVEQSDIIDIPSGTVASPATSTGFFTRYLADTNTLATFGNWLWTTDFGLQVAKAVISLIYGDPAQSVISLMSYPFNISRLPGIVQATGNIIWGNFNSGISSAVLSNQAAQIDWGTIQLSEYWGNFLDYAPHTKVSLYLPWGTGFVDLDPGECLPGQLSVKTNVDFSKGSCVHNVFGNGNLIGSFAGQCAQQIPILSSDYASKVAGLVTAAAAGISAGAVGGAGVLAEAAMGYPNATISGGDDKVMTAFSDAKKTAGKIATTSLAINRHPVHISRNGGFTDGSAALGCQYPYVIISRPKQSMPVQYGSHYGYPSNIYRKLGTLTGYTEVGEIHLEGIPATDAELSELDRILKGGVIF